MNSNLTDRRVRRIVTGHNADGKAVIAADEPGTTAPPYPAGSLGFCSTPTPSRLPDSVSARAGATTSDRVFAIAESRGLPVPPP